MVILEENELKDFKWLILASFILIFMILAAVFESLSTPFVLMFSIPLAAIGSMLALIITGNSLLSANTLTGFLILLGIVVNNGIILICGIPALYRSGLVCGQPGGYRVDHDRLCTLSNSPGGLEK